MSQYRRLPAPSYKDREIPPKDWMPTLENPRVMIEGKMADAGLDGRRFQVFRCERELFIAGYMPDGYPMKQYRVDFFPMPLIVEALSAETALALAYCQFPFFAGRLAVEEKHD